ncbi:MAG: ABC transporter permease subunit, partial [Planctomycetia bacterium]|nr:ABC transporter permease subunit [Planctomycetia bacterium]
FVLVPIMNTYVEPFLVKKLGLGNLPLIGNEFNGFGYFTAGLVLALMILPFISAMMRDVFRMIPSLLKEAAIGIGCTHWEAARDVMLRYGLRGLFGAVFIGLGRALGETMAVLFVIGNVMNIPSGVFGNGTTIAATLANNFAEADGPMKSALFALALILMIMSVCAQCCAQYYLKRANAMRG